MPELTPTADAGPNQSPPAGQRAFPAASRVLAQAAVWLAVAICVYHYGRLIRNDSFRADYCHFDEPNWIWIGYQTCRHIAEGDVTSAFWKEPYAHWGCSSSQLGKYFIGAPVYGYLAVANDMHIHKFGSFGQQAAGEYAPDFRLYYFGRLQAALLMMLTAIVLIDLARAVFDAWSALAAAFWFVTHPYIESYSFRAMTDTCAFFGMALALRGLFARKNWAMIVLCGLGLGWAIATRLNGLVIAPVVLLGIFLRSRHRQDASAWRAAAQSLAVLGIGVMVFYATNPYLWQAPVSGVRQMLGNAPGGIPLLSAPGLGRLISTFTGIFWDTSPTGAIPSSPIAVRLVRTAFLLFAVAVLYRSNIPNRRLCLILSASLWAILVIVIPRDWDRYYLPAVFPLALLSGYGTAVVGRLLLPHVQAGIRKARELEQPTP